MSTMRVGNLEVQGYQDPYLIKVGEGEIPGHTPWMKIGYTPTLGTGISDLWSKGGVYAFPGSAQIMTVSSDAAADTAGSTGAQSVTIYYLDANYVEHTETVAMSGTTPATAAGSIYRVNGFRVTSAGAGGYAAGNISLNGGTVTYSYISAGFTRARNSAFTIPANQTLYVVTLAFSYGYAANQTHFSRMFTRATQNDGARTPDLFYPYTEVVCANSTLFVDLVIPTKLVEKVDIKVSGSATISGVAAVAMRGWIETNA